VTLPILNITSRASYTVLKAMKSAITSQ